MSQEISVFDYTDPCLFLADVLDVKKKKNPRFTIRAWAQQMGVKHHGQIHDMIKGKRFVPKSLFIPLIRNLDLNEKESIYLEVLIDLQKSKTEEERNTYLERMRFLSPRPQISMVELDNFRYLESPLHIFIAELSLMSDFQQDIYWIRSKLKNKFSLVDIQDALERLKKLKILVERPDGSLERVERYIMSKSDVKDMAVRNYHTSILEMSKSALTEQDVLSREFLSISFNFPTSRMQEMKEELRKTMMEVIAKYESFQVPDEELFQLNFHFFGLSEKVEKTASEIA